MKPAHKKVPNICGSLLQSSIKCHVNDPRDAISERFKLFYATSAISILGFGIPTLCDTVTKREA